MPEQYILRALERNRLIEAGGIVAESDPIAIQQAIEWIGPVASRASVRRITLEVLKGDEPIFSRHYGS